MARPTDSSAAQGTPADAWDDLPDPTADSAANDASDLAEADDLLAAMADDAIGRMLAEADQSLDGVREQADDYEYDIRALEARLKDESPPPVRPLEEEESAALTPAELDALHAQPEEAATPAAAVDAELEDSPLAPLPEPPEDDGHEVVDALARELDDTPTTPAPQPEPAEPEPAAETDEAAETKPARKWNLPSLPIASLLGVLLKPLEWINAPLTERPKLRDAVGKISIVTFLNAAAVLLYVLLFRR